MKKVRVLALILTLVMLFQGMPLTIGTAADSQTDTIVLYPEYPEKIERDYMYRVYVSQGGEEYEIPVYNSMRHSNHYVRGDLGTYSETDRRFCQFSATPSAANPVTVRVVVNTNFNKVSIISPMYEITQEGKTREAIEKISPSKIQGNEIYFEIKNSSQYVFRINDDNISNLAIFADPVETDIPDESASNVIVFDKNNPAPNAIIGDSLLELDATAEELAWYDQNVTSNTIFVIKDWQDIEFFELRSDQQLYIAPGAVLNSRIQIMGSQSNIKVYGRGMLRDFNDTRAYNKSVHQIEKRRFNYLFTVGSSWDRSSGSVVQNVTINDILLFDAKGFNLVFQGAKLCYVNNIKIVANEISTDGISFWGANAIKVKDSFLHVADNVFVMDQFESLDVDNVLAGSTISTFYPQGPIYNASKFNNITLFRAGTIFEPAGGVRNVWGGSNNKVVVTNLSAVDCVAPYGSSSGNKTGALFSTGKNAWENSTKKYITLENVSLPDATNSKRVEVGVQNSSAGNYHITLKNVYVGTTALTDINDIAFTDSTSSSNASTVTVSKDDTYTPVTYKTTSVSYSSAYKTYIKDASLGVSYYSLTKPYSKNNVLYVSAKTTAEKLGFNTYFDADDMSLAIYDENVLVRATAGSATALYNDTFVTLSAPVEYGEEIMVPVDLFQKTIAPQTKISGNNIIIGNYSRGESENLFKDGDFERANALESWTTINFARLTRYAESDDNVVMRFFDKNIFLREYKNEKNETVDVRESYSFQGVYQDMRDAIRANGTGTYRITFRAKCNENGLTDTDLADTSKYHIFAGIGSGYIAGTTNQYRNPKAQALTTSWQTYTQDIFLSTTDLSAAYAAIVIKGALDVSVDNVTFTKVSDVDNNDTNVPYFTATVDGTSGTYTLNYGTTGKTVSISGANTGIKTIKYETSSDYIKLGETTNTTTSPYKATATIEVAYPSNYERYARIIARGGSGKVVGEITIKIPAYSTHAHVVDYDCNLIVKDTYKVGDSLDTSALKLTNVKYNDGTTGTVSGSDVMVTGADFTTVGEKTITVTYDNKSVSYTTKVDKSNDADLVALGASIRIAEAGRSAGLRFLGNFKKGDSYNAYYGTGDYVYNETNNFQFGSIFVPVDKLPEGKTVIDLFEADDPIVLHIPGEKVFEQDDESLTFTGCIVGIPVDVEQYKRTIQCAFYIKIRENAGDEWTYIYSETLQRSYYSVAETAYYEDYLRRPTLTQKDKKILEGLQEIVDFVEEDAWINGYY